MAEIKNTVVGIQEVAKQAGVSVATVSLAFSRKRPVSEPLRQKIFQVARQMKYEPNQWAQTLVRGKTHVIGVMLDTLNNPYFVQLVEVMEDEILNRGYQSWLSLPRGEASRAEKYLAKFRRMRLDGLIASSMATDPQHIGGLIDSGIPVATPMWDVPNRQCNPVQVDFADGVRQVLEYLYSLGHRKTAYIAGSATAKVCVERLEAYRKAVRKLGMVLDERLIVEGGEGTGPGGPETEELLRRSRDFTAIISNNDSMAFASIGTLYRHGIRVPQDISVTGFDNVPTCEIWPPRLTSVSYDLPLMAKITVTQLLDQIEKKTPIETQVIKPKLIVRDSCGPVGNESKS